MISEINNIEDVKKFFRQLLDEDLNFHPDTPFDDYINSVTSEATYTPNAAEARNTLMASCFEVCEILNIDIYELSIEIFQIFNHNTEVI